jgi:hypothetical protein
MLLSTKRFVVLLRRSRSPSREEPYQTCPYFWMWKRKLTPTNPWALKSRKSLRGCLRLLRSMFFSQTLSALHTLLRGKGGVVRAPKDMLHKLQFFVEQSQTPPSCCHSSGHPAHAASPSALSSNSATAFLFLARQT